MTIEEFIEQFAELFDESYDLTPQTRFRDLPEWNSLMAIGVLTMINEEYEVSLKGSSIQNATTIEDLFNLVANKKS